MDFEEKEFFPTLRAILHPDALAEAVGKAYGLDVLDCFALKPHISDIYMLLTRQESYILRIYPHTGPTLQEIQSEIQILLDLQKLGISVAAPLPNRQKQYILRLPAPEGMRTAVLLPFVDGVPLNRVEEPGKDHAFGVFIARFHQVYRQPWKALPRQTLEAESLLWRPLSFIEKVYAHSYPDEVSFLRDIAQQISLEMNNLTPQSAAFGMCHGDLNFSNVILTNSEAFTLFDFEYCGLGWQIYDLATTINFEAPRRSAAFLEGYQSVRRLTKKELNILPWMQIANKIWMLGTRARWRDQLGYLRFSGQVFEDILGFIRETAARIE